MVPVEPHQTCDMVGLRGHQIPLTVRSIKQKVSFKQLKQNNFSIEKKYVYMFVWMNMSHVCKHHSRMLAPPLQSQVVVSHPVRVLGTELGFSEDQEAL